MISDQLRKIVSNLEGFFFMTIFSLGILTFPAEVVITTVFTEPMDFLLEWVKVVQELGSSDPLEKIIQESKNVSLEIHQHYSILVQRK